MSDYLKQFAPSTVSVAKKDPFADVFLASDLLPLMYDYDWDHGSLMDRLRDQLWGALTPWLEKKVIEELQSGDLEVRDVKQEHIKNTSAEMEVDVTFTGDPQDGRDVMVDFDCEYPSEVSAPVKVLIDSQDVMNYADQWCRRTLHKPLNWRKIQQAEARVAKELAEYMDWEKALDSLDMGIYRDSLVDSIEVDITNNADDFDVENPDYSLHLSPFFSFQDLAPGSGELTVKGEIRSSVSIEFHGVSHKSRRWAKKLATRYLKAQESEGFEQLLAMLRAMHFVHWTTHWQVGGDPQYGDHLLFQRFYEAMPTEIDDLAEKVVSSFGVAVVDPVRQADRMHKLVATFQNQSEDPFQRALAMERVLQANLKTLFDSTEEKGELSLGMNDYLAALANAHETNLYLLQQRLSKG